MHITRADQWSDNEGRKISRDEWDRYVSRDPELSAIPDLGPDSVAWTVPGEDPGDNPPWLAYDRAL